MQTWPMAGVGAAQPDLARQAVESAADVTAIELVACASDEEMGRFVAAQMACSARGIACQDVPGRGVERYQPGLAELAAAHGEHAGVEVDIARPQAQRFAHAQAGHAQQAQQCEPAAPERNSVGATVADVLRAFGPAQLREYALSTTQARAWQAIGTCRAPAKQVVRNR